MEWNDNLAAIRFLSSQIVHIVEHHCIDKQPSSFYSIKPRTVCEISIAEPFEEADTACVDCDICVAKVEYQQAYWKKFWSSADGIKVFNILTGQHQIEEEKRKLNREIEAFIRNAQEFTKLLDECLKHTEPVFTLELTDDVLLKLVDYGSVGEVLFVFKLNKDTHEKLKAELGKTGYTLLGSRLISRGLLKPNDPIFSRKQK
jgi:hypothetical protein